MGTWIKMELKMAIDNNIDKLQQEIGEDIDIFYEKLDEFRVKLSGVEKPKNISGLERVSATVLGTIAGGPLYGALGVSLGLGEVAKRSAVTLGATFTGGVILAFTPVGIAAATTATTVAVVAAGILQFATGGKALTNKYKKKLKESFIESLKNGREDGCKEYAKNIACDVREKFNLVNEALDAEIQIEKSKVESLRKNKKDTVEERAEKLAALADYEEQLNSISSELNALGQAIE